jgi:hypothetical protein
MTIQIDPTTGGLIIQCLVVIVVFVLGMMALASIIRKQKED